jgi:hypothetical protein
MMKFLRQLSLQQWRNLILWYIVGVIGITLIQIGLLAVIDTPAAVRKDLGPPLSGAIVVMLYIAYLKIRKSERGDGSLR